MPTFGEWESTVLMSAYEDVDFISCHAYYEERDGDLATFLASAVDMDRFIDAVTATIDHVKARKRSDHVVNISFDEWNVWYNERFESTDKITGVDNWPRAPRLLEDVYTVADAVVVGNLLISLLRRADRVQSASLAQLVNVIAPIMTEPGGPAWKQTTFFPFALTSKLANGQTLATRVECDEYETATYGTVPTLDAVATRDDEGRVSIFVVNRSLNDAVNLDIALDGIGDLDTATAQTLADPDYYASNTLADQHRVLPRRNETLRLHESTATIVLPPVSWSVIVFNPR